ncbi:MAG: serine/threonine-protein kinase, partial [Pseudomonadota bacterium]
AEDAEFIDVVRKAAGAAADAGTDAALDQRVGNYRLVDLLGAGGMGNVYLAVRADEQYEQRVAIKLLHPGRRDRELIKRFVAERQVLARLEHPNIARLLDGGETDGGVPYLVMEFVEGVPVDEFCDHNRLSLTARLRLFQKICAAVEYAHNNLVVHRDIKPSNILVAADGEPKLLDFGIAKLLDEKAFQYSVALTRIGTSVMTPEFASPEQVRAEPVSTATDVYSLGVLLYRMLCGRMPYRRQGPYADLARAIVDEIPTRPSASLTATSDHGAATAREISTVRGASVASLKGSLSGDLDNIVLKALRKKPENRYASAREFADDIERYLTFRPVSARPASIGYRTAKFLRRYRAGVSVAGAVLVLIVVSVFQILEQRNRAQVAALQAEEVIRYVGDLFRNATPLRAQSEEISARDLLDQGVEEIDSLADEPEVQARLLDLMGNSFMYIGEQERALALLNRSLELRRTRLPYDPAAVGNTLQLISTPNRLSEQFAEAEQNLREAHDLLTEAYGDRHGSVAYVLSLTGDVLRFQKRHEEALGYLERAVAMKEQLGEADDDDMVDILGNLALAYDDLGRYEEAESVNRRVVAASRARFGDLDPQTLIRIANLGLIQVRRGNYADGLVNIREAHGGINEIWTSDPNRMVWAAGMLGYALRGPGRLDESLAAYERARDLARQYYGADSMRHARALMDVGESHLLTARPEQAAQPLEEAIAIAGRIGEDPSFRAGSIRIRLAMLYSATGDYERAEAVARRALAVPEKLATPTRLAILRELGVALSGQHRFDEASALFEESLLGRETRKGMNSTGLLPTLIPMARHYRRAGNVERALELASRAHALGQAVTPAGTWEPAFASAEYALVLKARGDEAGAASILDRAIGDLEATFGADDPRVVELRLELASMR